MSYTMKGWSGWSPMKQKETKTKEGTETKDEAKTKEWTETEKTKEIKKEDPFLVELKKTNPEAYSTKHPTSGDTLYYIKQGGNWVQTW